MIKLFEGLEYSIQNERDIVSVDIEIGFIIENNQVHLLSLDSYVPYNSKGEIVLPRTDDDFIALRDFAKDFYENKAEQLINIDDEQDQSDYFYDKERENVR